MVNETNSTLLNEEDDLLMEDEQSWYEHLRRVVDKGQTPLRIDKYLAQLTDKASRSRIQNAAEAGANVHAALPAMLRGFSAASLVNAASVFSALQPSRRAASWMASYLAR